jgi:CRISP-associated protein Cas1
MLFSHRQGVLYVEHCRIVASDEQLSFVRAHDAIEQFWSIPHANTCVLLCGPGTSITHQAAHKLAEEQVVLGFVGGGGTPLFYASQSEYRPTEFCQRWVTAWQHADWRLTAGKRLARYRCEQVLLCYQKDGLLEPAVSHAAQAFQDALPKICTVPELLGHEATFAKHMYAFHKQRLRNDKFLRTPQGSDATNQFIDAGNYMAYGLAASVLWVLGIPHAFPVTHGMTRRGALVFDVADVIKDAMLLPLAFECAALKFKGQAHRARCLAALDKHQALTTLFDIVKAVSELSPEECFSERP